MAERERARTHALEISKVEGRRAVTLVSPEAGVQATLVPGLSMLCSSLTLDGKELLGHPETLRAYAEEGRATGMPLLHPWANRLGGLRLAGLDRDTIDPASPLVPVDDNGLPIHGLRTVDAGWTVTREHADEAGATVAAALDYPADGALGHAFPFPHRIEVTTELRTDTLAVTTEIAATGATPVPISFGWHPYFRLPGVPRREWVVSLPVTCHAALDAWGLPTGADERVSAIEGTLGDRTFDDLFPIHATGAVFALGGGASRLEVTFDEGYPLAHVYAPSARDVIAIEPMTAPTNALVTGERLTRLAPGESYRATFTVRLSPA